MSSCRLSSDEMLLGVVRRNKLFPPQFTFGLIFITEIKNKNKPRTVINFACMHSIVSDNVWTEGYYANLLQIKLQTCNTCEDVALYILMFLNMCM